VLLQHILKNKPMGSATISLATVHTKIWSKKPGLQWQTGHQTVYSHNLVSNNLESAPRAVTVPCQLLL
jgi:hypothetical protein